MSEHVVEGPYFDELKLGDVFDEAFAVTLTTGLGAAHQGILGNRLRLALDEELSRRVRGGNAPMAHPALIWDGAIGQFTVIHNEWSRTSSTEESSFAGRRCWETPWRLRPRSWRCARTGRSQPGSRRYASRLPIRKVARCWTSGGARCCRCATQVSTRASTPISAPELARLTLNIASAHHDEFAGYQGRLVYGGHTIGLAMSRVNRVLPDLVTVAGWYGCDHVGPVEEGDTLHSRPPAERVEALNDGGSLAHLRVLIRARSGHGSADRDGLDWRPIVVLPTGGGT